MYLSNHIVQGLADKDCAVGVVVPQPEALVRVAPRKVAVGISRNQHLRRRYFWFLKLLAYVLHGNG